MADHTLIEIHVQGSPGTTALAADDLMNVAQMRGYVVRINEAVQGISKATAGSRSITEIKKRRWRKPRSTS